MGFLDDIIRAFAPSEEDQNVRHAIGYLAPKFCASGHMPGVARGEQSRCESFRKYVEEGGRQRIIGRRHELFLEPGADRATYGEEVGHCLHMRANPALDDAVHFDFRPSTRDEALRFVELRNWEECIGRYAGLVYAKYCGEQVRSAHEEYPEHYAAMEQGLGQLKESNAWSLLTHMTGYGVADELLAKDPWGAGLAQLARVPPKEVPAYVRTLESWRRQWAPVERRHAAHAEYLVGIYSTRR
jgi:hypothetical protein